MYLQFSVDVRAACSSLRAQPSQSINTAPATMCPIQTVYDNQIEVGWVGGTIV